MCKAFHGVTNFFTRGVRVKKFVTIRERKNRFVTISDFVTRFVTTFLLYNILIIILLSLFCNKCNKCNKFSVKIFFYPFLGLIRISKMTRKSTIINPIASIIFLNTLFSFSSTYLFSTVVEAVTTGIFFSCVRVSTFSVSPLMETEVSIPAVCFWSIPVNTIPVPGIYDKVPVSVERSAGTCIVSMVCFSINSDLTNFCLLLQPATATSSARQKKIMC